MSHVVTAPVVLRDGDRSRLEALTRSSSIRAGLASRARIVLLAAKGLPNAEIARRTGTSRRTVVDWRARYVAGGIRALHDQPRSGRPPEIDEIDVVVATLADDGRPPARLGVTHWSARLLAAELKISFATVARIWRKWNLQPWRTETACVETFPIRSRSAWAATRAKIMQADFADPATTGRVVAAAHERLGSLDVLVGRRRYRMKTSWEEVNEHPWDHTMAVNARGPFFLAKPALPGMLERGFGRILFFSSIAAINGGVIGFRARQPTTTITIRRGFRGDSLSRPLVMASLPLTDWCTAGFGSEAGGRIPVVDAQCPDHEDA